MSIVPTQVADTIGGGGDGVSVQGLHGSAAASAVTQAAEDVRTRLGVAGFRPRMSAQQASSIVKDEKKYRRERQAALEAVVARNPGGKLADKAGALLLDYRRFEDWIEEAGDEDTLLRIICAQVASGVTLRGLCRHYVLEYGLLWDWLGEKPERIARYENALRGIADAYVAEVVPLTDEATPETVPLQKMKGDKRLQVAAIYDKKRFGREEKASVNLSMQGGSLVAILSEMRTVGSSVDVEDAVEVIETDSHAPPVVVGGI